MNDNPACSSDSFVNTLLTQIRLCAKALLCTWKSNNVNNAIKVVFLDNVKVKKLEIMFGILPLAVEHEDSFFYQKKLHVHT